MTDAETFSPGDRISVKGRYETGFFASRDGDLVRYQALHSPMCEPDRCFAKEAHGFEYMVDHGRVTKL